MDTVVENVWMGVCLATGDARRIIPPGALQKEGGAQVSPLVKSTDPKGSVVTPHWVICEVVGGGSVASVLISL